MAGLQKNQMVCSIRRFSRRFEQFNASLITKRFIEMDRTGKFTGRRSDWLVLSGWSGLIFKTMIATIILRCPLTCHNFNFLSLSWRVEIKLAFASLSLIWKFWWLHWGDHVLLKVVVAVVQLVSVIDSPVQLFICNFISLLFVFCQSVRKYNRSKFESFKTRENKNVYVL